MAPGRAVLCRDPFDGVAQAALDVDPGTLARRSGTTCPTTEPEGARQLSADELELLTEALCAAGVIP